MTEAWKLSRGATPIHGGARFSVWAPNASRLAVVIEGQGTHPLEPRGRGVFEGEVKGIGPGTEYRYRIDEQDAFPDPVSRSQPKGVHGPSRVIDPTAFLWTDTRWKGLEMADYIIYELHVGTFSESGNFAGVASHLAELKQLGVTAIEIMPVAEFPGARNWGYDGVHLYAPHSAYGGPEELRRLVNTAHGAGLAVILDVVYNHVGPEGNYLGSFGPYFTETYRTPWGKAVNYDGADSDEVRRFVIDNALHWITEYHVDALRLDAIHGIFDFGARHVLRDLTDAAHAVGATLGRRVHIIGESDLNDPRVVRGGECGFDMDAQWSDDLHHAIHARVTEETRGYYSDFGGVLPIAKALQERFVFDGRFSASRKRRHGAPATDVRADHFVVCIQNHDQVGNRAIGDRLSTLVPFEKRKVAAALYLLSPYVPMLFMGEEYDETHPFLYFVSHGDEALAEAVRKGRKEEFKSFGWSDDVPDPQSEETFRRSRLDRTRSAGGEGGAMLALYRDLIRLRRQERALRPGDATVTVEHDEVAGWIRLTLSPNDRTAARLVVLFNLSDQRVDLPLAASGSVADRPLRVLATDDNPYTPRASPGRVPSKSPDAAGRIAVSPWSAVLHKIEAR
jgi:maltooligosyltrehalose trehalohydrolase